MQSLDVLSGSDSMHVNEPKVRARTIIVSLAVTSDLSSQEHMPPPALRCPSLFPSGFGRPSAARNQESKV